MSCLNLQNIQTAHADLCQKKKKKAQLKKWAEQVGSGEGKEEMGVWNQQRQTTIHRMGRQQDSTV